MPYRLNGKRALQGNSGLEFSKPTLTFGVAEAWISLSMTRKPRRWPEALTASLMSGSLQQMQESLASTLCDHEMPQRARAAGPAKILPWTRWMIRTLDLSIGTMAPDMWSTWGPLGWMRKAAL